MTATPGNHAATPATAGARFETWVAVDLALRRGTRGLPGGSSLPKLLAERCQARNTAGRAPLTEEQVLQWADAYYRRTGLWPTCTSGRIPMADRETWNSVD